MQCKDIPTRPILQFLDELGQWGTWFWVEAGDYADRPEYESKPANSVRRAMPKVPDKLCRAKMASLMRRGLIDGCPCGCRGDYELTLKGRKFLHDN